MKKRIKIFGLLIIVLTVITSCSKDFFAENLITGNYSIRSILTDGKTISKFTYNTNGKIAESQSFYFCNKYTYDDNNRLIKEEVAVDPNIVSSSMPVEKTELMTSQNSTFTGYYLFEYDSAGKLVTQKNYFKKNGQYTYTSMITFEYEGDKIIKRNLHNSENTITQFYTYEYDQKGNVTKEKYYSYLFISGTEPKLVSEVAFKYDDKNNPFIIYKDLGQPGIYSNTNNIIETSTISYVEVQGIDQFSTSQTTYQYNDNGFPIRVNNAEEYLYE